MTIDFIYFNHFYIFIKYILIIFPYPQCLPDPPHLPSLLCQLHVFPLFISPPKYENQSKPKKKPNMIKHTQTIQNETKATKMESIVCWPTTPRHVVCPGVYLIYLVTFLCWKLIFSFLTSINCKTLLGWRWKFYPVSHLLFGLNFHFESLWAHVWLLILIRIICMITGL